MTSILLVEPTDFGSNPKIRDNAFIVQANVSESRADADQVQAFALLKDLHDRLIHAGVSTSLIRLRNEPRHLWHMYEGKGDAIFPNNAISFHNFTDSEGKIIRRVVVMYPMSPYRRGELPKSQIVEKLQQAAGGNDPIELIDLRSFEEEDKCLEGTGVVNFSYDGKFAYMSRSGRTNDEVFEVLCSEENLNIPAENRFTFAASLPNACGGEDVLYHTNVLGWCGKGICAWGLDYIKFDSEEHRVAFYEHLDKEYESIIVLNEKEIRGFAGNALEVATYTAEGKERRFLCMSETAAQNMQSKNMSLLKKWYGEENILTFYGDVVERRTGGSIRCMLGASVTHGPVIPSATERSTMELAGIIEN